MPKIERNEQRTQQVNKQLQALEYTIFRFLESDIKNDLDVCVGKIIQYINKGIEV